MSSICDRFEEVLTPYVGPAVAKMVLRGAARGVGKDADELEWGDVASLVENLRSLLEPVMSADAADAALAEAERRASL